MPTMQQDLSRRVQTLIQLVDLRLRLCPQLETEVAALKKLRMNAESTASAVFVTHLIDEAQTKLNECKITTAGITDDNELANANLATCNRWVTEATDLLNRAQLVLDHQQDIWGKPLPTGGLWDK